MRKLLVNGVVATACLVAGLSLAFAALTPAQTTRVRSASVNFACVALWNIGICVGPPTKQA